MSLGKKDIIKNISTKANLTNQQSTKIFNSFLEIILLKTKVSIVKLPNFGVFYLHSSPKRLGRNPKTKEEFLISERNKFSFKASNKIKSNIN